MRSATNRSSSGCTVRSSVATIYQFGFVLHATPGAFRLNRSAAGAKWGEKQLAAAAELTRVASEAANDPSLADRTWVLLTEAPDGGWGIGGHAYLNDELIAAARAELGTT